MSKKRQINHGPTTKKRRNSLSIWLLVAFLLFAAYVIGR